MFLLVGGGNGPKQETNASAFAMVRDNPEHQTTSLAAFGPADNAHIEPQCSITPLVWMCVTGNIEAGKCNLVDTQDNFVNTELCMGQTGVSF